MLLLDDFQERQQCRLLGLQAITALDAVETAGDRRELGLTVAGLRDPCLGEVEQAIEAGGLTTLENGGP